MAYNSAGPGPESERFLERTFKLRPQKPPTAVQVTIGIVDVDVFQLVRLISIKLLEFTATMITILNLGLRNQSVHNSSYMEICCAISARRAFNWI